MQLILSGFSDFLSRLPVALLRMSFSPFVAETQIGEGFPKSVLPAARHDERFTQGDPDPRQGKLRENSLFLVPDTVVTTKKQVSIHEMDVQY
jgi:hypothetical protein